MPASSPPPPASNLASPAIETFRSWQKNSVIPNGLSLTQGSSYSSTCIDTGVEHGSAQPSTTPFTNRAFKNAFNAPVPIPRGRSHPQTTIPSHESDPISRIPSHPTKPIQPRIRSHLTKSIPSHQSDPITRIRSHPTKTIPLPESDPIPRTRSYPKKKYIAVTRGDGKTRESGLA